jgi:environmental stress-induced protein Ves
MQASRILRISDARIRPWKNGRGETAEILVLPEGADFLRGDFDVRISRAAVIEDGPFSNFAGFDRVLVVVSGNGIVLDHGDGRPPHRLAPCSPYRFSGDAATVGRLIDGPIEDFNVITRRGRASAETTAIDARPASIDCSEARVFVHVVHGQFEFSLPRLAEAGRLVPTDSLDVDGDGCPLTLELRSETAEACAIVVRIGDKPLSA